MNYAILGLLVFIAVLVIFILAKVVRPKQPKPRDIFVYRDIATIPQTVREFEPLGYKVKYVKRMANNVCLICFVKVR